ncbi:hypothetical protein E8E14_003569 [Neopestalotiopsis sp. 37M]|nr:hypothetical protein E8E14_003569 [Neopestalotiopsis sp. 37M]
MGQEQSDKPSDTSPQHAIDRLVGNAATRGKCFMDHHLELHGFSLRYQQMHEDDKQKQLDSSSQDLALFWRDLSNDVQGFARVVEEWSPKYSATLFKMKGLEMKIQDKQESMQQHFALARYWFHVFAEPQGLALQAMMDDIRRGDNGTAQDSFTRLGDLNTYCIEVISGMLDHETSKDPQRTDPQYLKLWELYEQQKGVTEELGETNDLCQQLEDAKKEQSSEDAVFRQLKDLEETLKKQVKFRRKREARLQELRTLEHLRVRSTLEDASESLYLVEMARQYPRKA